MIFELNVFFSLALESDKNDLGKKIRAIILYNSYDFLPYDRHYNFIIKLGLGGLARPAADPYWIWENQPGEILWDFEISCCSFTRWSRISTPKLEVELTF